MPTPSGLLTSDRGGVRELLFHPPHVGPSSDRGRYLDTKLVSATDSVRQSSIDRDSIIGPQRTSVSPSAHADEFLTQSPAFAGTSEAQWQQLLRPANLTPTEQEEAVRAAAIKALNGLNGVDEAESFSAEASPFKTLSAKAPSPKKRAASQPRVSLIDRATIAMKVARDAREVAAASHTATLKAEAEAAKAKEAERWAERQPTHLKPFRESVHQATASSTDREAPKGGRKSPATFYDRSHPTRTSATRTKSPPASILISTSKSASTRTPSATLTTVKAGPLPATDIKSVPSPSASNTVQPTSKAPQGTSVTVTKRRPLYEDPLKRVMAMAEEQRASRAASPENNINKESDTKTHTLAFQQNRKVAPLSLTGRADKASSLSIKSNNTQISRRQYLSPSLSALLAAVGMDDRPRSPRHRSSSVISLSAATDLPTNLPWGPLCASLFIIATLFPSIAVEQRKAIDKGDSYSSTRAIKRMLAAVAESPERTRRPLPASAEGSPEPVSISPNEEKEVARAVAAELIAAYAGKHQQLFLLLCKRNSEAIDKVIGAVSEDLQRERGTERGSFEAKSTGRQLPWLRAEPLHVVDLVLHLTMAPEEYAAIIENLRPLSHATFLPRQPTSLASSRSPVALTAGRKGSVTSPQPRQQQIQPSIYPTVPTETIRSQSAQKAGVRSASSQGRQLARRASSPVGSSRIAPKTRAPAATLGKEGSANRNQRRHYYPTLHYPTPIPLVLPTAEALGLSGSMLSSTRLLADRFGRLVKSQHEELVAWRLAEGIRAAMLLPTDDSKIVHSNAEVDKEPSPEVESIEIIMDGGLGGEQEEPEVRDPQLIQPVLEGTAVDNEGLEHSPVYSDSSRLAEEW